MVKDNLLIIGDNRYQLDKAISIMKSGPDVVIEDNQINDSSNPEYRVEQIVSSKVKLTPVMSVIFFKQNGKFTIIAGKDIYEKIKNSPKYDGKVPGKLISTVALKKAKILEELLA